MYRTVFGLTFILLLICQSVEAQSSISRLIGTKKEYYLSTIGWKATDSSRYVYSTFGSKHNTPYYSEIHPELVGRLPLYYGSDAPYYFTGMFSVGSDELLYNPDSWMADSIVWYWFDVYPYEDEWSFYQIINRHYYEDNIDSTYSLFTGNSPTNLTVQYNDNAQPIKQSIAGSAFSVLHTLIQSPLGFMGYTTWTDDYGSLRKYEGIDYTLDVQGRPVEELHRLYDASLASNPSHVESRMTYTYTPSGLVSNRNLYTSGTEGYICTDSFSYYYNNDILKHYLILHRDVDTTVTPSEIGNWDTLTVVDLYFSGDKIDSLVRRNTDLGDTDLEFDLREQFTYTGNLLTTYKAYYYSYNTVYKYYEITHSYDANNRLTKLSWYIEFPSIAHK